MRVLVTGTTGFVGRYIVSELLTRGYEVYAFVRPRANRDYKLPQGVKIIEGVLEDFISVKNAVKESEPDAIFHIAAQSFIPRSFENPVETINVNVVGTVNILEAVRNSNVDPVMHLAGSSEEYGIQIYSQKHYESVSSRYVVEPPPREIPELPIREDNPMRPVSPYAISKLVADRMWLLYNRWYGLKTVVTRAFNHEGPGRGPMFVTSQIVQQVKIGSNTILLGNMATFRDWSHVLDTVNAYVHVVEKRLYGEPWVVGSARTNSVLTFALLTLDVFEGVEKVDVDGRPIEFTKEKCEIKHVKFDCWSSDKLMFEYLEADNYPKEVVAKTSRRTVRIISDKSRLRPLDVPVLLSDPSKIMSTGWKPKKTLLDVVRDMLS